MFLSEELQRDQAERQAEFLRRLSADDRASFDEARRAGLSFGEAELSTINARRRREKQAHRPATAAR